MKVIKVSDLLKDSQIYLFYALSILAILTLIVYTSFVIVDHSLFLPWASVFSLNGAIFCGWMLYKYKDEKIEYRVDRYLWLGVSCFLLYICLQMIDSGFWLFIPSILLILFYLLFLRDEIRVLLAWKKNVKIELW